MASTNQNQNQKQEFIMFELNHNLGYDMNGKYFVQLTDNEDAIKKFKKINKNNDALKFYKKKYSLNQIMQLKNFEGLWNLGAYDVVERYIFVGKMNVPDPNRSLNKVELENWWGQYFTYPKSPEWSNMFEGMIDLIN